MNFSIDCLRGPWFVRTLWFVWTRCSAASCCFLNRFNPLISKLLCFTHAQEGAHPPPAPIPFWRSTPLLSHFIITVPPLKISWIRPCPVVPFIEQLACINCLHFTLLMFKCIQKAEFACNFRALGPAHTRLFRLGSSASLGFQ